MSACISREGEYSDHEPGDYCPRCGAFNEEAILGERDALRAEIERLRAVTDEQVEAVRATLEDHLLQYIGTATARAALEAASQAGGDQ